MNKKLPEYLLEKYQLVGMITFSFLFALVFLNIYIPFSETAWFRLGNSALFLSDGRLCRRFLFVIGSRIVMYKTKKYFKLTYLQYILWCIAEIVCICAFYTFFTMDLDLPVYADSWWAVFGKSLLYGAISLAVPYIISAMYFAIIDKNKTIKLMSSSNVVSDQGPIPHNDSLISLFDYSGALKLSIRASSLYYIESDDNYIRVWYTDASKKLKMYILRCRLKTIEENFRESSLVRCHRKYIVNIERVKLLRKEAEGYYLELDNGDIAPVLVTKTYEKAVLASFADISEAKRKRETKTVGNN